MTSHAVLFDGLLQHQWGTIQENDLWSTLVNVSDEQMQTLGQSAHGRLDGTGCSC
jgi:hypothetical protein